MWSFHLFDLLKTSVYHYSRVFTRHLHVSGTSDPGRGGRVGVKETMEARGQFFSVPFP